MKTILICLALLLTSCQALDLRDSGGTIATTGVAYLSGGIVPAVLVAGTDITYNAVIEKEKDLAKVKNAYQASVVLGKQAMSWTIIGFIFFLICATFCRVWLTDMLRYIKNMWKPNTK